MRKERKEQETLREKYDIEEKNVVVKVENKTVKLLITAIGKVFCAILIVAIFLMACAGVITMLYLREPFFEIIKEALASVGIGVWW